MSHFTVLVIGKNPERQLAPYDENKKVTPYECDCYCIGNIAQDDSRKKAALKLGSIHEHRAKFKNNKDQSQEAWGKFIQPLLDLRDKYTQEHPLHEKADSKCAECNGSGKCSSTYNPNSKWDWYALGGRWSGFFKLKKGSEGVLGESGAFDNPPEFDADQARKKDIDFEYIQTSKKQQAETDWVKFKEKINKDTDLAEFKYGVSANITKKEFVKKYTKFSTFAVVKDGIWYAKGEMGWWGMVKDKMSQDEWDKQFSKLLNDLPKTTLLSIYDCHI